MIVKKLQDACLRLPLPGPIKNMISSPKGPFTSRAVLIVVFFWAPSVKWFIAFVNLLEYDIPIAQVSTFQQTALFTSGMICARNSWVITPRLVTLVLANMVMSSSAGYQLYRKA